MEMQEASLSDKIPLCVPSIGAEEHEAVRRVLESGWLTHGPHNAEFEELFAKYLGVRHAVCLNSCASALQLAIEAHGITGEVILPSFTFVASANAIVRAGATPIFADVDPTTCNIDPAAVAARIGPRTEAIMPVHFAGQSCDMTRLTEMADRSGLAIIEDSAETIGGLHHGAQAGSFGTSCFSFFPTKNLTTCEGGMLATNDREVAERVRILSGHGIAKTTYEKDQTAKPWYRSAVVAGYNMRMSNVQAAMGVQQISRVDDFNDRRRQHAAVYDEAFASIAELSPPVEVDGNHHVYQMYTVQTEGIDRDLFLEHLRRDGVGASVHFDPPVHEQQFYADVDPQRDLPVTEILSKSIVTLPMFPDLTETQRQRVIDSVRSAVEASRLIAVGAGS